MKHIRRFNESLFKEEDLQDILLELTDLGYGYLLSFNTGVISIYDNKSWKNGYIWDDIKDCILRIKDYLGPKYLSMRIGSVINVGGERTINSKRYHENLNNDTEIKGFIKNIRIYYVPNAV